MSQGEIQKTNVQSELQRWALKLFSRSPLKQKKFSQIEKYLGLKNAGLKNAVLPQNLMCLDVGSDNGVISLLLRQKGGTWYSCDLIPETVAAIRSLVGERVDQIDGEHTPYPTHFFDLIVIVDFLEHIESDQAFIAELARIIKPDGHLIISVPNPKAGCLRSFRALIGQTDKRHGHLRPGYSPEALQALIRPHFDLLTHESYSRIFAVWVDILITAALDLLKKDSRGAKGTVLSSAELSRLRKSFKLYNLIYPILRCFAWADERVPFLHGNMLIAEARPHLKSESRT